LFQHEIAKRFGRSGNGFHLGYVAVEIRLEAFGVYFSESRRHYEKGEYERKPYYDLVGWQLLSGQRAPHERKDYDYAGERSGHDQYGRRQGENGKKNYYLKRNRDIFGIVRGSYSEIDFWDLDGSFGCRLLTARARLSFYGGSRRL